MSTIKEIESNVLDLAENGYDFDMGSYISRGWDLFKENTSAILVPFLVYIAASSVLQGVGAATGITQLSSLSSLILAPMSASLIIIIHRVATGQATELEDLLIGYKEYLGPILLAGIVSGLLMLLGIICLIVPGIYLMIAYSFVSFFVVLKNYDFWPAIEASRKVISKKWFSFFGFVFVLGLINILGALCLLVGLLVTIPVSMCAMYFAFSDIVLSLEEHETDLADNLLSE